MGLGRDDSDVPSGIRCLLSHLVRQKKLSKLQVVAFQDGGAMQFGQRVARSVSVKKSSD